MPCDLSDGDAIGPAVEAAVSALGGLDLVVNNAGLGYRAHVRDLEPDPLQRLLAVNVAAVLLVCRAAHPHLAAGERPVLVNVRLGPRKARVSDPGGLRGHQGRRGLDR